MFSRHPPDVCDRATVKLNVKLSFFERLALRTVTMDSEWRGSGKCFCGAKDIEIHSMAVWCNDLYQMLAA